MADRRILENGSARLQEDGASRLLEQQPELFAALAVTEDGDTVAATAELSPLPAQPAAGAPTVRRRARRPELRLVEEIELQRISARLTVVEDDDTIHAQVDVLTGRRALRNNEALALLLAA